MKRFTRPTWPTLLWIGIFGIGGLLFTSRLLPAQRHPAALLLWLVLFYGAVAVWLRRNDAALELEPPALDCVGRPVLNQDTPFFEVNAQPCPAPTPLVAAPGQPVETM